MSTGRIACSRAPRRDRQGRTWAEIGAIVGQRSLKVTRDTYTHMLIDSRELDHAALLTRP